MNTPRAPVAFDLQTVESRTTRDRAVFEPVLKPGTFLDAFKSTAARPRWAVLQSQGARLVPRAVEAAIRVRSRDIHWTNVDHHGLAEPRISVCHRPGELAQRLAARESAREFWKRVEDSLNGGPPAYEMTPAEQARAAQWVPRDAPQFVPPRPANDKQAQLRHIFACLKSAPCADINVWRIPLSPPLFSMDTASPSLELRTVDAHRIAWKIPVLGEPWRFRTLKGWQCEFEGVTIYWPDPLYRNPAWLDQ